MVPNISDGSVYTNGAQSGHLGGSATPRGTDTNGATPGPASLVEALPPAINDFDAMINAEVRTFVNMSEEIGGLVAEQVCQPERSLLSALSPIRSLAKPRY